MSNYYSKAAVRNRAGEDVPEVAIMKYAQGAAVPEMTLSRVSRIGFSVIALPSPDSNPTIHAFRLIVSDSNPANAAFGPIRITHVIESASDLTPDTEWVPTDVTTELVAAGGNFRDFTVVKPVKGAPPGALTFTGRGPNRADESYTVEVPAATLDALDVAGIVATAPASGELESDEVRFDDGTAMLAYTALLGFILSDPSHVSGLARLTLGQLNIAVGLVLLGESVSFGANDSGGTGKRALVVENAP